MIWKNIKFALGLDNMEDRAERSRQELIKLGRMNPDGTWPGEEKKPSGSAKITVTRSEPGQEVTYPFKKPSKAQIEECAYIGLEVTPIMSSRDIWQTLKNLDAPELKLRQDIYHAAHQAIYENEERDEYGNDLINELNEWDSRCCSLKHYIAAIKNGKTVTVDILELERVEIESDVAKPYLFISALRPKIDRSCGAPYLEWAKEYTFKTQQVIHLGELSSKIDGHDIDEYHEILEQHQHLKNT